MAAAAKYGAMIFRGQSSGISFMTRVYASDVTGQVLRWDEGNGPSSTSATSIYFNEGVILEDYSTPTPTDCSQIRLTANGRPIDQILDFPSHLNTLATRPRLAIPFKAGTRIGGIQLT